MYTYVYIYIYLQYTVFLYKWIKSRKERISHPILLFHTLSLSLTISLHLSASILPSILSLSPTFPSLSLFLYPYLSPSLPHSPLPPSLSLSPSPHTAKVIDRKNLAIEDEQSLQSEVSILKQLKHQNIVTCSDFFAEEKKYYLVLEYMEGGELFDRIVKKSFYNEKEARDVVYTLLSAIEYCHSNNIVHR